MSDGDPQPNDAAGHRARLRQRLLDSGGAALQDYELVEYLLALARPRINTKPTAKALLRRFQSLPRLLEATPEALAEVDGMGETSIAALKVARAVALRMLKTKTSESPILSSWQALIDYLTADMAHGVIERVRVLHLDSRNRLLSDEIASEGSLDQSAVYVREVLRRAMDLGSAALILVHNHPSGDPSPSRQDIALTREIAAAGKPLGVIVHDHVIIGASGHASLRALGLL